MAKKTDYKTYCSSCGFPCTDFDKASHMPLEFDTGVKGSIRVTLLIGSPGFYCWECLVGAMKKGIKMIREEE